MPRLRGLHHRYDRAAQAFALGNFQQKLKRSDGEVRLSTYHETLSADSIVISSHRRPLYPRQEPPAKLLPRSIIAPVVRS